MATTDLRTSCAALGAALCLMMSVPAMGTEREHREHGAHDHGHGVLEIAVDGEELVIVLRIPAVNMVGFEHAASNEKQRRAVTEAIERFSKGRALFVPSKAARCEFEDARIELAGMESEEAKHDHDSTGTHEEKSEAGHSEMHAEYRFHCHAPKQLSAIEVAVFDHLQDAEEIDAYVITEQHQGTEELTPKQTTVRMTP